MRGPGPFRPVEFLAANACQESTIPRLLRENDVPVSARLGKPEPRWRRRETAQLADEPCVAEFPSEALLLYGRARASFATQPALDGRGTPIGGLPRVLHMPRGLRGALGG